MQREIGRLRNIYIVLGRELDRKRERERVCVCVRERERESE